MRLKGSMALAGTAVFVMGVLLASTCARADDDGWSKEEREMIRIGYLVAPVPLKPFTNRNIQELVGLGSYLVNVVGGCNGCHSAGPPTQYVVPHGNPYFRTPPYDGIAQVNPATYLGGGRDFGGFPMPTSPLHIISRNLTPDKSGLAEGGHTLDEFIQIIRTGVDMDHLHPNCSGPPTSSCMPAPFDGDKLQIMPWPELRHMTDRDLTAIWLYLNSIPCIEGGPGEPPIRCQ